MYQHLTEVQKAYWAGILDGEGHISLTQRNSRRTTNPLIILKMTCPETIKKFSETFNLNFKTKNRETPSFKEHWKTQFFCSAEGHKAAYICEALLPYFITKKEISLILANYYNKTCTECDSEFRSFKKSTTCSKECQHKAFLRVRRNRYLRKKGSENKDL